MSPEWTLVQAQVTSSPRPLSRPSGEVTTVEPVEERSTLVETSPFPRARPDSVSARFVVQGFDVQAATELNITEGYRFTVPTYGDLASMCMGPDQYFQADGTLGEKGRILARELTSGPGARSTPMKHLFFRNTYPDMSQICRNFGTFNDDQKLNFWIWYNAAKARTESECGRNAYNPNDPAGVSIGEMQMPASYANRWWRGLNDSATRASAAHAGGCEAEPPPVRPQSYTHRNPPAELMAQTENNLTCAVEVLAGVLCGFYQEPTEQCNDRTYAPYGHGFWRQLRVNGDDVDESPIIQNIRSFPLCGNPSS